MSGNLFPASGKPWKDSIEILLISHSPAPVGIDAKKERTERPLSMNIILMGYRCTGKTSAGRRLAERLGQPFYDTDALVEGQMQRTIPQIVAERGWQAFREAETAVIRDLSATDHSVIALGGGAVLDVRNVESLKRNGFFVWLSAEAETIAARMEKDADGDRKSVV